MLAFGILISTCLLLVQSTFAKETSVAEEILEILYENGQINQEQYQKLLKKARKEEQRREKAKQKTKRKLKKEAKEDISPEEMDVYWKNGFRFESQDKNFKLKLGGRLLNDWGYIDGDSDVENRFDKRDDFGSGTEMRQGRLFIQGILYDSLMFKAQYDFAGGDADFKDTWFGFKDVPYVGNIKIGHFKEPFSLEELTSRKYITFMERSLPGQTNVPGRNTGFMIYDTAFEKNMTWAFGGFRETDGFGNGFGDDEIYNLTTRMTAAPVYKDNGKKVLHLGLSYSHKWLDDNATIDFSANPESHLTTEFVDTDFVSSNGIRADDVDLLTPELAMVYGPFSLQGEYMYGFVDTKDNGNVDFKGYYVQGSYFLTGEHRNYDRSSGAFGRVKPSENFNMQKGGIGAWEAAFRYSNVDLNDKDIDAGEMDDYTLGLNWYLYPNLRIMFNYIYSDLEDVGDTNIFQSRFQLDF